MVRQVLNRKKTKALILYVCSKLSSSKTFGSTVLNKILYYVDHLHYVKTGETMTGFKYIKQHAGPTPSPGEFLPLRLSLEKEGKLQIRQSTFLGKQQKKPIALSEPDLSTFTSEEIAEIDAIIDVFENATAALASSISHDEIALKIAEDMEELPPYTFLLTRADLTEDDLAWAQKVIKEHRAVRNSQGA